MLPDFYIAENNEFYKGGVFIIGTRIPYPIAQVFRFNTEEQVKTFESGKSKRKYIRIPGYYVVVSHFSNMDPGTSDQTSSFTVLQQMADFFMRTRMEEDKGYWKRYAEKPAP